MTDSQGKRPFLSYDTRQRLFWLLIAALVASPFVLYTWRYRASVAPVEFTVDHRERVTTGSGDSVHSYYLVWSREGEVFTVADSWAFLMWDSSDRYGKLREGSHVRAKVAGWRIGFLSAYRNVIEIETVTEPGAAAESARPAK